MKLHGTARNYTKLHGIAGDKKSHTQVVWLLKRNGPLWLNSKPLYYLNPKEDGSILIY